MQLQQLVNGIIAGSVYALFALGLTLVFGVLDILNLAHAAVFMLGAFGALTLVEHHVPFPAAVVLAAIGAGVLGIVVDRVGFRPLRNRADSNLAGLTSSIAISTILGAIALGIFGPDFNRYPVGSFPDKDYQFGSVTIGLIQLLALGISLIMMASLAWLLARTGFGRQIRAVAANPLAAKVSGVHVEGVISGTFFLSSMLGGLAGVMYGLLFNQISTNSGQPVLLKGLAVIIVGGMASIVGAMIAGFLLGLVEVFTVQFIGSTWKDFAAFGLLFLILVFRPQGLAGRRPIREI
jgi:branched-chain amino acid transport system permease protein